MYKERSATGNGKQTAKKDKRQSGGTRVAEETSNVIRHSGENLLHRFLWKYPDITLNADRLISGTRIC